MVFFQGLEGARSPLPRLRDSTEMDCHLGTRIALKVGMERAEDWPWQYDPPVFHPSSHMQPVKCACKWMYLLSACSMGKGTHQARGTIIGSQQTLKSIELGSLLSC